MQKGNCLFKKKKKKGCQNQENKLEKITAIMSHEGTAFTAQHALKMLEAVPMLDLHHMIIVGKQIHDFNIIAISLENLKKKNAVSQIQFNLIFCLFFFGKC